MPQVRGDLPQITSEPYEVETFAPHVWGCAPRVHALPLPDKGCPAHAGVFQMQFGCRTYPVCLPRTHVGMPLCLPGSGERTSSLPCLRRDVPDEVRMPYLSGLSTPRTWGSTLSHRIILSSDLVCPTHVGMYPSSTGTRSIA